ncbi:MAG: hypothetical protein RSB71_01085 [Bacilli bacterium]
MEELIVYSIFKIIGIAMLVFVGVLVVIVLIVKIKKNLRYKTSIINTFKNNKGIKENAMIIDSLNKINTYNKIISLTNGVIYIDKSGLYVIKLFKGKGVLKGDLNDEQWFYNNMKTINPFNIKGDYNYIISEFNLAIEVTQVDIVTLSQLTFKIGRNLNNNDKYNTVQIDELYLKYVNEN